MCNISKSGSPPVSHKSLLKDVKNFRLHNDNEKHIRELNFEFAANFCRGSRESTVESSVPPDSEAESAVPPKAKRPRAKKAHALEVAKQGRTNIHTVIVICNQMLGPFGNGKSVTISNEA